MPPSDWMIFAPRALAAGTGEGAVPVAEELALNQAFRDRRTVERHEGLLVTVTGVVMALALGFLPVPVSPSSITGMSRLITPRARCIAVAHPRIVGGQVAEAPGLGDADASPPDATGMRRRGWGEASKERGRRRYAPPPLDAQRNRLPWRAWDAESRSAAEHRRDRHIPAPARGAAAALPGAAVATDDAAPSSKATR